MADALTAAEAVLHRTGPNNITVLFEARGGFDAERAFRGVQMLVQGAERFRSRLAHGRFSEAARPDWSKHVTVVAEPGATAADVMDIARRLPLPSERPLWRVLLVNAGGVGWSGLVLHFDHAIADGTRIARHIVTQVRPGAGDRTSILGLAVVSLADLRAEAVPRLDPAPIGLCRVPFAALRAAVPEAVSHGDALLRLGRRMLDTVDTFADVPLRRKNHATVAKIEALQSGGRLGNHAQMEEVDLSKPSVKGRAVLFRPRRTPLMEHLRMGAARLLPAGVLRRVVQAEFSRPAIVLTIVPVSGKPVPLFGLPLAAIHPAAPALGRPMLALTAVRYGDGFDLSVTAHGPDGGAVADLSGRVAARMAQELQ